MGDREEIDIDNRIKSLKSVLKENLMMDIEDSKEFYEDIIESPCSNLEKDEQVNFLIKMIRQYNVMNFEQSSWKFPRPLESCPVCQESEIYIINLNHLLICDRCGICLQSDVLNIGEPLEFFIPGIEQGKIIGTYPAFPEDSDREVLLSEIHLQIIGIEYLNKIIKELSNAPINFSDLIFSKFNLKWPGNYKCYDPIYHGICGILYVYLAQKICILVDDNSADSLWNFCEKENLPDSIFAKLSTGANKRKSDKKTWPSNPSLKFFKDYRNIINGGHRNLRKLLRRTYYKHFGKTYQVEEALNEIKIAFQEILNHFNLKPYLGYNKTEEN